MLNVESIRSTPEIVQISAQYRGLDRIDESSVKHLVAHEKCTGALPPEILFFEDKNWWGGIAGGEDDHGKVAMIRKWVADEWEKRGTKVTTLGLSPLTERRGDSSGWYPVLEHPNRVAKITYNAFGATHPGFRHPFIVPESIQALEGDTVLSFSEWYEGSTDLGTLSFSGSSDLVSTKFCLARLAEGMQGCAHMHERGWAHLDFKPSNVLVREGRGMLSDLETMLPIGHPVHNKERLRGTETYLDWALLGQREVREVEDTQDVFAAGISILRIERPNIRGLYQVRQAIRDNFREKSDLAALISEMVREKPNQRPTMRQAATRLQEMLAKD